MSKGSPIVICTWYDHMIVVWRPSTHLKTLIGYPEGFTKIMPAIKSVYKWMFLYKWPLYDLFWPFFCHMYVHLSQNWGSDGHFEVLNRSYLWLVEKLWHKTQIFPFLFLLRFCTKTDVCNFYVFCGFVFFVITFVPIKI